MPGMFDCGRTCKLGISKSASDLYWGIMSIYEFYMNIYFDNVRKVRSIVIQCYFFHTGGTGIHAYKYITSVIIYLVIYEYDM